jgi:hypothetical protein
MIASFPNPMVFLIFMLLLSSQIFASETKIMQKFKNKIMLKSPRKIKKFSSLLKFQYFNQLILNSILKYLTLDEFENLYSIKNSKRLTFTLEKLPFSNRIISFSFSTKLLKKIFC